MFIYIRCGDIFKQHTTSTHISSEILANDNEPTSQRRMHGSSNGGSGGDGGGGVGGVSEIEHKCEKESVWKIISREEKHEKQHLGPNRDGKQNKFSR